MRQTHFPFRTSRRQKEILGTQSVPIFFLFGVIFTFFAWIFAPLFSLLRYKKVEGKLNPLS